LYQQIVTRPPSPLSPLTLKEHENLLAEMNMQMVDAKYHLEAERNQRLAVEARLRKAEEAILSEREQWRQETNMLKEQVGRSVDVL